MFSNNLICNILEYIDENFNRNITIDELSRMFYFDRTYIMKKFKNELSISIVNYINKMRIYNSLKDYRLGYQVIKIAINNGFNSLEYYSEIFKKVIGVSPIIYKRFTRYPNSLSEKDLNKIRDSVVELQTLKDKQISYKENKKPVLSPVKKLTIFK